MFKQAVPASPNTHMRLTVKSCAAPAVQGDFERMDHHGASVVRAVIGSALSLLDTKERLVMRMRYGLDDGQPRTLEEIGRYFKVSPWQAGLGSCRWQTDRQACA